MKEEDSEWSHMWGYCASRIDASFLQACTHPGEELKASIMAFWHAHEKLVTASHEDSADKQSETHSEFLKAQDRLYHAAEGVASANKNGGEEAQACEKDRMDPSFLEDISELVKAMQISRAAEEAQQEREHGHMFEDLLQLEEPGQQQAAKTEEGAEREHQNTPQHTPQHTEHEHKHDERASPEEPAQVKVKEEQTCDKTSKKRDHNSISPNREDYPRKRSSSFSSSNSSSNNNNSGYISSSHNSSNYRFSSSNSSSSSNSRSASGSSLNMQRASNYRQNNIVLPLPHQLQPVRSLQARPYPHTYSKYFIIKSFSEENVYTSIKHGIWASTTAGMTRLDAAFREMAGRGPVILFFSVNRSQKEMGGRGPVILLFSVNRSQKFCGMAEMISPVDFSVVYHGWKERDSWRGLFKVRWDRALVKDIPIGQFSGVRFYIPEEQRVACVRLCRDATELPAEQGRMMVDIFSQYQARTSILQDAAHYERLEQEREQARRRERELQEQVKRGTQTAAEAKTETK